LAFVYHPQSFGTFALAKAAQRICDLVWVADTSVPGVSSMSRLLSRLGELVDVGGLSVEEAAAAVAAARPDGILALHDSQLPWTASIARRLALPCVSPEVAERLADKYIQREALRAAGLPVGGCWALPDEDDRQAWTELATQARFPAVLKPRRGAGSRDVVAVRSLEELPARLAEISDGPGSRSSQLLLDEYLRDRPSDEGQDFAGYVSVESIVSAGRVSHLAITGRFPPAEPFRESGFFIPSALDHDERDAVLEVAGAATAAIGVTVGCLHTEIKLTPDGPRVIEVNGRVGGGTPEMLAAVTDVDLRAGRLRALRARPGVDAAHHRDRRSATAARRPEHSAGHAQPGSRPERPLARG
jgi:biotin carboxylase